jgi:glycosyltransferase involved in cell wall biosynthesis
MTPLYILFAGRYPGEKAAALYAKQSAESFVPYANVELIVPRRFKRAKLGTEKFRVLYLPVIDLMPLGIYIVTAMTFALSAWAYLRIAKKGVVMATDLIPALVATFSGQRVVVEVHDYPERHLFWYTVLFKRAAVIIATNEWKKNTLAKQFPFAAEKIIMERNGVDLELFAPQDKQAARAALKLPSSPLVVYTGHLYEWKGVNTLAAAATKLPDVSFAFVGGTEKDVANFKTRWPQKNIHVVGFVPHRDVPMWQAAADVLVLPNSGKESISENYTSPMKLFEYMASKRAIVASRLPSIVEIVDESSAYLFTPDDAHDLARAIREALLDSRRAEVAHNKAQAFSWDARAKRILKSLMIG